MTPQQAKELLPIIAAYAEGREVQCRIPEAPNSIWHKWRDFADPDVQIHMDTFHASNGCQAIKWRIKPDPPRPREWWLCPTCRSVSGLPVACVCNGQAKVKVREVVDDAGGAA